MIPTMDNFDAKCVLNFYSNHVRKGLVEGIFSDTLVPNFEYPDWSHLTIEEALRKINALDK